MDILERWRNTKYKNFGYKIVALHRSIDSGYSLGWETGFLSKILALIFKTIGIDSGYSLGWETGFLSKTLALIFKTIEETRFLGWLIHIFSVPLDYNCL